MPRRSFVLLDRDGTLIADRGYLSDPSQVELLPGAAAGLRHLRQLGLGLIVVTNQSGIARRLLTARQLGQVHKRLRHLLRAEGVDLDRIYFCPHHPEDDCLCRKPRPGMVRQAARDFGFDPGACFVIGDKACDIKTGQAVGARTVLVRTGYGAEAERRKTADPDGVADDLFEAAAGIEEVLSPNHFPRCEDPASERGGRSSNSSGPKQSFDKPRSQGELGNEEHEIKKVA